MTGHTLLVLACINIAAGVYAFGSTQKSKVLMVIFGTAFVVYDQMVYGTLNYVALVIAVLAAAWWIPSAIDSRRWKKMVRLHQPDPMDVAGDYCVWMGHRPDLQKTN